MRLLLVTAVLALGLSLSASARPAEAAVDMVALRAEIQEQK